MKKQQDKGHHDNDDVARGVWAVMQLALIQPRVFYKETILITVKNHTVPKYMSMSYCLSWNRPTA